MKIFYLTPRIPYPIDKGDKLRAFYQLKYLSKEHEIFLFAIDENSTPFQSDNPLNKYCSKVEIVKYSKHDLILNLLGGLFKSIPFQTSYYYSKKTRRTIIATIEKFKPDIIYCQLIRSAEFVKDVKSIPTIIDYVDVISKGLERRISKSNIFWRLILSSEYKRAIKYEEEVFKKFTGSIIITKEDQSLLPFSEKEKVLIVPNGIDMEFFKPIESEKQYDLFFSGNLNYPPNVDAAKYIVKEILPLLKLKKPSIKVLIAGANPKKELLDLASENVDVKGWVDDIREYYSNAKIFLAPMQIGTGLQNKLLQAMSMKLPCVTSELTMKGIANGEKDVVLVAKSPEEYVECILKLLNDDTYFSYIGQRGYEHVEKNYDWQAIINNLSSILKKSASK